MEERGGENGDRKQTNGKKRVRRKRILEVEGRAERIREEKTGRVGND